MQIDVIGGSGFIGTRLLKRLQDSPLSCACSILDKSPSRSFPAMSMMCDVRSLDQLRENISEGAVVVNLAAEHRDDVRPERLYYDVNVEGARNICTVAREKKVEKIIFTSTVAVYGFAEPGLSESGAIAPFNHYGRSKAEAEGIFVEWQREAPDRRTLVVVRPTVVFGEGNRGNVYNLIKQVGSRKFVMIGNGENLKSIAYVDNVAALIEYSLGLGPGHHLLNYVDKPDFSMNELVILIKMSFGHAPRIRWRLNFIAGYSMARLFDLVAAVTGRKFAVSSIRVRKFCADSVYRSAVHGTSFRAPVPLDEALARTIRYDFLESHVDEAVFHTE